ncbi:MAG: peptide deformylase [Mariniphaga sp.]|nr:peptide deformylase [Mariniphaga sp.]MDD4424983.1 peptide deformylase [Mariniphaga sp.]
MNPKVFEKMIMPGVKNIIVIASGKGGVGKSTVAANLAGAIIVTTPMGNSEIEPVEKVFLNPVILNQDDNKTWYKEGCLSIPGIFEDVKRPEKVEVRYRDLNFDWKEEILTGLESRIFQHEYDHLQGILFVDRLSAIRKKIIRGKLHTIAKNR